jgi:hypothetical protein
MWQGGNGCSELVIKFGGRFGDKRKCFSSFGQDQVSTKGTLLIPDFV